MKALSGCLAVIGGIVVLVFIFAMCSASSKLATPSGGGSNSGSGCKNAVTHTNQAWKDYDAGDYKGGYRNANTAVALAASCDEGGDRDSALGFALSARGLIEHHMSVGDSRTDLNQAEQLLASCQSDVGYYGTHAAAVCETQEQNDISAETNWELSQ